jgi:nucleoside-diphosphate-sugar epimerase
MSQKLLLTGATGYIGGSVLTTFLNSSNSSIKALQISVLVRSKTQAKKLTGLGVHPILFQDFDDTATITKAASEHDIVIHTASGLHTNSAIALVRGLAERKKSTGRNVIFIHTSGTSKLGDKPITEKDNSGKEIPIYSDRGSNMYETLKKQEAKETYGQRTKDLAVVETGLETSVQTYILMSPTIYGTGTGLFNRQSIQIPMLMRSALASRQAEYIGDGEGIWDYVHIADLSKLYEFFLAKILGGYPVPFGKDGIFFTRTGEYRFKDLAAGIGKAGFELGVLDRAEPKSISLGQASKTLTAGIMNEELVELGFASK